MEKHGASSGTGTRMKDVLCRSMGDHSLPSQWKEGFVKAPSFHQPLQHCVDPLLRSMEAVDLGLCVNNLYGGTYLHADAIRTVATPMTITSSNL